MRLQTRIEDLERKASPKGHTGPEIIFLRAARVGGVNENQPQLQCAFFVGFGREQLRALDGETDEQFGTRAEQHLADLKREKEAIEHRSNRNGE